MSFSSDYLVAYNLALINNQPRANSAPTISRPRPINTRNCITEVVAPIFCNKCQKEIKISAVLCHRCKKINYCSGSCERLDVKHAMVCMEFSDTIIPKEIITIEPKQVNTNAEIVNTNSAIVNTSPAIIESEQNDHVEKSVESDYDDDFYNLSKTDIKNFMSGLKPSYCLYPVINKLEDKG